MSRSFFLAAVLAAGVGCPALAAGDDHFERQVRPLLVQHCYPCHSAEAKKQRGGLRVDTREALLAGGLSGAAVVPGAPEKSLLVEAVRYHNPDLQMPPDSKLPPAAVAALARWIAEGAPMPAGPGETAAVAATRLWSLQPPARARPPEPRRTGWARNEIDRFLLAPLEARGIAPAPDADRRTLLRRATYDLVGLPPTPEEVDAFVADRRPDAFARVVERLLASPQYGERWGRHWLDVVRYADTSGCNADFPIDDAWKYRDWVIRAFNEDRPYDLFLREQLAGDLMGGDARLAKDRIVATGYLALSRRFGSRNDENHLTIEDTIDNVGKALLGLSVGCARCHDHKYDPISQRDYYALYGILASTTYAFPGTEIYRHTANLTVLGDAAAAARLRAHEEERAAVLATIEKLQQELKTLRPATGTKAPPDPRFVEVKRAVDESKAKLERLAEAQEEFETLERAFAVRDGTPQDARIHRKGDPKNPGDVVPRGFLTALGGQKVPPGGGSGRRQLADWIADPENPLTARVMVNRIWQHHFGRGLVATPNDFGSRGAPPSHPELLDWLATRFVEEGWSVKAMHRLIMGSRAYQLSGATEARARAADPTNALFGRFSRRRLSAEEIRDTRLALAGALDRGAGGPHPFPPVAHRAYTQHKPFAASYPTNRRSVYVMVQRGLKDPFFEVFDGADPNASTATRAQSTTPLQALHLMNDASVHDLADRFAVRVGMAERADAGRIRLAYRLALGRWPRADELREGLAALRELTAALQRAGVSAAERDRKALASVARMLLASNEVLYLD